LRWRGICRHALAGAALGFGDRRDQDSVAFIDHGKIVGIQH